MTIGRPTKIIRPVDPPRNRISQGDLGSVTQEENRLIAERYNRQTGWHNIEATSRQ